VRDGGKEGRGWRGGGWRDRGMEGRRDGEMEGWKEEKRKSVEGGGRREEGGAENLYHWPKAALAASYLVVTSIKLLSTHC
jgi:hypothetical protein